MPTWLRAGTTGWLFCWATVLAHVVPAAGDDAAPTAPHKVVVELKVVQVYTTKLRNLGFDWAQMTPDGIKHGPNPVTLGIQNGGVVSDGFAGFLEALRQNSLARVLAEPTLVTLDGREALFEVTGHTKLEVLPIVMGNGRVRLEYRIDLSSPQSEPARSSYKREPPPAVTTVRLNSATNLDLGKLCVVGQMKTNVPAANGKTQEIETLVLARVDLVKPDSPVKTAAAPEGVPAAAATR